jgi:ribosomal protein S18 acetylase RimI-like enzyme
MSAVSISVHDELPPHESAWVDDGIGQSNDAAAPLHEVVPLACFARSDNDQQLIGGAIGRRWGACCELQQLWVDPAQRNQGIATQLMAAFEAHAQGHGCTHFYLETFSFQAPALYRSLGYTVAHELTVFPHGIVKYLMVKHTTRSDSPA